MFLRETNDQHENTKKDISGLRHQAGDMKDDDDYDDYNSYFFRFGRALISYDKNQMIKEANEKWSSEPCLEKKSPIKIRFSDDVNYVDPSDLLLNCLDEEIEEGAGENQFDEIEEDFVLFSQQLLNKIQSDLKKIPQKLETIYETDVNRNNITDDKGKRNQSKESNLCLRENETKEKNIKINVQNIMTNGHRNDKINRSENTKPSNGIPVDHSRTSIKNVTADEHLGKKIPLKTLSESEAGVSVLPLNQKSSLHDSKNIKDADLQGKHNPVKDRKSNLLMKSQKEVYNKDHNKYKDVTKKIQNKNIILDKPKTEIQSNNLNNENEEFNNVIKNCFLNVNVKQDNQKVKKKTNLSTEKLKNIPSSLMKVDKTIALTKQFSVSNKLETAKRSLQTGIVLNNKSKKRTLDNEKISVESTDINKKQTKNIDKLQTNITTTSIKVKNVSTKTSIIKKTKSQILLEKQKVNSKKTSPLLGKKLENISSMESKNVTNRLSTNKIPSIQPKRNIKISVNINKNASNLNNTTEKQCSNLLGNSDEKSKQKVTSVPAVTRVKSSSLKLQNVPDSCKNNKSTNAAKKSKAKCLPMVNKTERKSSHLRS